MGYQTRLSLGHTIGVRGTAGRAVGSRELPRARLASLEQGTGGFRKRGCSERAGLPGLPPQQLGQKRLGSCMVNCHLLFPVAWQPHQKAKPALPLWLTLCRDRCSRHTPGCLGVLCSQFAHLSPGQPQTSSTGSRLLRHPDEATLPCWPPLLKN